MMPRITNYLISNYPLSAADVTPEVEANPGDLLTFSVQIEGVTGAPSSASLAIAFQISPLEYSGYNLATESTSGAARVWKTVAAGDTNLGFLLENGDWPASVADQTVTQATTAFVTRTIRVPAGFTFVRLSVTPSFTGGTTPKFFATITQAWTTKA